jgi:hypothetical protein
MRDFKCREAILVCQRSPVESLSLQACDRLTFCL